jgi:hypothetical protein
VLLGDALLLCAPHLLGGRFALGHWTGD